MERREFLKFAFGIAAGAGAIAAASSAVSAAPLLVPPRELKEPEPAVTAQPAVADQDDLARAEVQQVHHRRWHRRHYRRRHYRRRHWRRW